MEAKSDSPKVLIIGSYILHLIDSRIPFSDIDICSSLKIKKRENLQIYKGSISDNVKFIEDCAFSANRIYLLDGKLINKELIPSIENKVFSLMNGREHAQRIISQYNKLITKGFRYVSNNRLREFSASTCSNRDEDSYNSTLQSKWKQISRIRINCYRHKLRDKTV